MNGSENAVNFNISCTPPEWLIQFWDINIVVAVVFNVIGFYFIVFQSTKVIETYKYFLLNIQVSLFTVDIFVNLLLRPVSLFPLVGGFSVGLLQHSDAFTTSPLDLKYISYILTIFAINNSTGALLNGVVYRWLLLDRTRWITARPHRLFISCALFQLLMCVPQGFFMFASYVPQEEIGAFIDKRYPNRKGFLLTCRTMHIWNPDLNVWCKWFIFTILIWILIHIILGLVVMWLTFRELDKNIRCMSEKTVKMHRQLTIAFMCQISLPICCIAIPIAVALVLLFCHLFWCIQTITQILTAIFSTHSSMNCILMLLLTGPYLEALQKSVGPLRAFFTRGTPAKRNVNEPTKTANPKDIVCNTVV